MRVMWWSQSSVARVNHPICIRGCSVEYRSMQAIAWGDSTTSRGGVQTREDVCTTGPRKYAHPAAFPDLAVGSSGEDSGKRVLTRATNVDTARRESSSQTDRMQKNVGD
jgi:hypothetical protein